MDITATKAAEQRNIAEISLNAIAIPPCWRSMQGRQANVPAAFQRYRG
jgi:hypothetical protein